MAEKLFDLTGNVSLVTGANSGLGFGFAEGLARAGSDLVIWGRRKDANEQAAEKLRALGAKVHCAAVDVSDEKQIVDGVAEAIAAMGRIDTVVANAGIANPKPFVDMDAETYETLMKVNQHGVVFTLREVARHMVARAEAGDPGGSMILCGSGAIFQGVPTLVHYGAAKGALAGLAKGLAAELGPHGVRCNVIAPGFIVTEMTMKDPEVGKAMSDAIAAKAPIGRAGLPDDLWGAVVYLASDLSRYHTGDTLVIDGGKMFNN
ncbi:SDR family oxidoreductase [Croceicoccus sp. F390]|uniref:SDR family oxidoreductase n=1 Tax=Croceicoccus esteveae TaxID=3075597 RepID=A0ABU2ZJA0_9SPHN|nr:SDR family oxidoreductase [Croceicoccus sp. F390]MDT0576291.1 SDR family oxidoreductase [Croceicoccus sp. F390]